MDYKNGHNNGFLACFSLKTRVTKETWASLGEMCAGREVVSVALDSSIRDAANQMIVRNLQHVPVVSQADPEKLLGWLTLNDIARQQNAAEG